MKLGLFLLSTLILVLFGMMGAFLFIKIGKKDLFGGIKAGMIVGVVGGVLGGFMFDLFFKLPILSQLQNTPIIKHLLVNQFDINFISSFLGVWLFLSIYEYVSEHTERS